MASPREIHNNVGPIKRTRRKNRPRPLVRFGSGGDSNLLWDFFPRLSFLFCRHWILIYLKRFVWIVWLYCAIASLVHGSSIYLQTYIDTIGPGQIFKTKTKMIYTFLSLFVPIVFITCKCIVYFWIKCKLPHKSLKCC